MNLLMANLPHSQSLTLTISNLNTRHLSLSTRNLSLPTKNLSPLTMSPNIILLNPVTRNQSTRLLNPLTMSPNIILLNPVTRNPSTRLLNPLTMSPNIILLNPHTRSLSPHTKSLSQNIMLLSKLSPPIRNQSLSMVSNPLSKPLPTHLPNLWFTTTTLNLTTMLPLWLCADLSDLISVLVLASWADFSVS